MHFCKTKWIKKLNQHPSTICSLTLCTLNTKIPNCDQYKRGAVWYIDLWLSASCIINKTMDLLCPHNFVEVLQMWCTLKHLENQIYKPWFEKIRGHSALITEDDTDMMTVTWQDDCHLEHTLPQALKYLHPLSSTLLSDCCNEMWPYSFMQIHLLLSSKQITCQ